MKNFCLLIAVSALVACTNRINTTQVLLTSENGEKCATVAPISFQKSAAANAVVVDLNDQRQTIDGYGVSLTESSAYVLACLSDEQRASILNEMFSAEGANFSLVRTQVGASDFSVEGKYALGEAGDDFLYEDKKGFPKSEYPDVQNEQYDLFQLMKEVAAIKAATPAVGTEESFRILANTWTAPAWMKDNGLYYERDWSKGIHRGGALLPKYYQAYANYLLKYLQAYREEGIEIWAMTPVNEPMGNDGGWESMDFPPAVEAEFIAKYMGPTFANNGFENVRIFGFDQNIFEMSPYTAAIYGDSVAKAYTTGMALHWYGSTFSCFPAVLDSIHALYPDKTLLHTEGCVDNLGCDAWDAVTDPVGFKESGWFGNDAFWWTNSATDWAYSTPYWPELHPAYSACQRYAQYIIEGMNHWMTGYIDWNCVLDSIGGPNHVNNFAAAPVMIDYRNNNIYYTPYYYVLKQFSKMMRPGDVALGVSPTGNDNLFVSAIRNQQGAIVVNVLNKAAEATVFPLQIGDYSANITAPANSVMTLSINIQ